MLALICSTNKKKWRIIGFDEDRTTLKELLDQHRAEQEKKFQELSDEEKLLEAIFGRPTEYKIVRLVPTED